MNFDDTPQEAAFRAEARAWIQANAPQELRAELEQAGFGQPALRSGDVLKAGKAWQKKKQQGGWACLHWPKEYGGRGATPIERVIWQQEEGVFAKLSSPFGIGQGMCGPTMMAFAARSTSFAICRRWPPATKSGASCSPSRWPARTWPACGPAPCAMATTGWSMARRSGPAARTIPTSASCSTRTDPDVPSTTASPCSSST
jgi:hypothetical protein